MTMDLSHLNLNESQLAAVKWQSGPLLVLAGPGSGKTRVLTCRIARLIAESNGARFKVLGVTFTNKAATEMRQRVDAMISTDRDRVTLTTFHSFAAEVLRQHGSHVGLKPDFSILTEQADREEAINDAIRSAVPPDADFAPTATQLLPIITRMLDECVLPTDAHVAIGAHPHGNIIAAVYRAYRERLISSNQLDFGTLLALAVTLLEDKPSIAKQLRRVYSHVCVDECQDTNSAQLRLLIQLVPNEQPNLFVVADDDQVIYQWNGASPARLNDIRQRYAMDVLQLPENYRCPPAVIDLANSLISHNSDRPADKEPLIANKKHGEVSGVTVQRYPEFTDELYGVAALIQGLPASEWSKCVILARRKRLLDEAVEVLTTQSIPAYIAIRKNEFQSAPHRFLHAVLRIANATQDREQLRRMTKAFFDLEGIRIDSEDVVARASIDQEGLLRAWLHLVQSRSELSSDAVAMLSSVKRDLADRLDYWAFIAAAHVWFESLSVRTGEMSADSAFAEFEDEVEIWNALKIDIAGHYDLAELSLHNFLQEVDLRAKEKPAPPDAVRCLTIAASKGMEFEHVFLIGLVEEELPGYYACKKGDASDEIREERRNCFVAITRAEETLTLTYSDRYFGYNKSPSRFLKEMGLL